MSFNPVEKSIWNLTGLRKFLEGFKFVLKLFVVSINRSDHLGHITNRIRIKTHAKDHPAATKCILNVIIS